jgi:ABC-type nitrate/sulfonate/bicarbonate transport system ATPase subunit
LLSASVEGSYEGQPVAVNGSASKREFICVVGPSGGKSTLLNLIRPGLERGRVTFEGRSARSRRRRVVAFRAALYPWLNAANVEFGLKMKGTPGKARRHRRPLLELVNLTRFEALVHESGGMKQRVQLARALAVSHMLPGRAVRGARRAREY